MKKLLIMSLLATLTACGGGSGDGGGDFSSGGGASKLVGMWSGAFDKGDNRVDEVYMQIDDSGFVSYYDYAGDTYNNWGNCYWHAKRVIQLKSLGVDRYEATALLFEPPRKEILVVKIIDNTLTMQPEDDIDDEELLSFARSNRGVAGFTPECVDSASEALRLAPPKDVAKSVLLFNQ